MPESQIRRGTVGGSRSHFVMLSSVLILSLLITAAPMPVSAYLAGKYEIPKQIRRKKSLAFDVLRHPRHHPTRLLLRNEDEDNFYVDPSKSQRQPTRQEVEELMAKQEKTSELAFTTTVSLLGLVLAVSLFFTILVYVFGDSLLPHAPSSMPQRVDADQVLMQDFQRYDSSVDY